MANLNKAIALAKKLISIHLPSHWSLRINRRRSSLGCCSFGDETIELSGPFIQCNSLDKIKEITLHEIAHALAGENAGHGPLWAEECRKLGIEPIVKYHDVKMPPGKYSATCTKCSREYNKQHKPAAGYQYICPTCKVLLSFTLRKEKEEK